MKINKVCLKTNSFLTIISAKHRLVFRNRCPLTRANERVCRVRGKKVSQQQRRLRRLPPFFLTGKFFIFFLLIQ